MYTLLDIVWISGVSENPPEFAHETRVAFADGEIYSSIDGYMLTITPPKDWNGLIGFIKMAKPV